MKLNKAIAELGAAFENFKEELERAFSWRDFFVMYFVLAFIWIIIEWA